MDYEIDFFNRLFFRWLKFSTVLFFTIYLLLLVFFLRLVLELGIFVLIMGEVSSSDEYLSCVCSYLYTFLMGLFFSLDFLTKLVFS